MLFASWEVRSKRQLSNLFAVVNHISTRLIKPIYLVNFENRGNLTWGVFNDYLPLNGSLNIHDFQRL